MKTLFVTGAGDLHRVIELGTIDSALGSPKLAALPALHVPSGAHITGRFLVKENLRTGKHLETQTKMS